MGFYKELAQIFYYVIRSFKMIFKKKNLFFIGVILFVVLVFGFYNSVFAYEDVSLVTISGVNASNSLGDSGVIRSGTGFIEYFHTDSNYIYTITNTFVYEITIKISVDVPAIGVSYNTLVSLPSGESYTFVGSSDYYFHYGSSESTMGYLNVIRTPISGFDDTTNKLTDQISVNNLWSVFPPLLVAIGVLFALLFVVVQKVLKDDNRIY